MAVTKVQANWTNVSFGNTTITRVNSINLDHGGQLATYKGDADIYATVTATLNAMARVRVSSADIATINGFGLGTVGTFTAKHLDAQQATNGAIVWTMVGATVENATATGQHGQFGTAELSLVGQSPDGVSSPLSFTRD